MNMTRDFQNSIVSSSWLLLPTHLPQVHISNTFNGYIWYYHGDTWIMYEVGSARKVVLNVVMYLDSHSWSDL